MKRVLNQLWKYRLPGLVSLSLCPLKPASTSSAAGPQDGLDLLIQSSTDLVLQQFDSSTVLPIQGPHVPARRAYYTEVGNPTTVAGHDGVQTVGPVFFKPIVRDERGIAEQYFFEHLAHRVPEEFLPKFYGVTVKQVPGADRANSYLALEDVTARFKRPCVMDIKMGRRTWGNKASAKKIDWELRKHPRQALLGFRVCGSQVFDATGVTSIKTADLRKMGQWGQLVALRHFFSDDGKLRKKEIAAITRQLRALEKWFESQRSLHFYGTSILMVYEGDADAAKEMKEVGISPVDIRLIDFAHVETTTEDELDEGFLHGLRCLIDHLESFGSGHLPKVYGKRSNKKSTKKAKKKQKEVLKQLLKAPPTSESAAILESLYFQPMEDSETIE